MKLWQSITVIILSELCPPVGFLLLLLFNIGK